MLGLRLFCFSFVFGFVTSAISPNLIFAYVPKVGQVFRFQPQVLRSQKSFKVKGSATSQSGAKVPFELTWVGQGEYQITFNQIPRAFFFSDSQKSLPWTLKRSPKNPCTLNVEGSTYTCEEPLFWAMIELSAMPDTTAKSFAKAGFISQNEIPLEETDGRLLGATPSFEKSGQPHTPTIVTPEQITQSLRVRPGLGFNGNTPTAVLEIKGDNFTSPQDKLEEGYPLLHFDPTFLAPILARWKSNGQTITLKAQSDVEVRRRRPRFTHILAGKLEAFEGANFLAAFERKEPEILPKKPIFTNPPTGGQDIAALRNLLSTEGQSFLTALLLTH